MSPHVARLRAALGHELIVLPSVSVLPVDASGRLLLAQVANNASWHIIGGAVQDSGGEICRPPARLPACSTGMAAPSANAALVTSSVCGPLSPGRFHARLASPARRFLSSVPTTPIAFSPRLGSLLAFPTNSIIPNGRGWLPQPPSLTAV